MTSRAVKTACPYCGVGCGVLATADGKGGASIGGDPSHPANLGQLCSKGTALGETLGLETRLLHPMVRNGSGALARASWDAALDTAADGFARTLDRYGPEAIAFYLSGQLLTEDYYVANKLMKGFLGSSNVDTNSRLCMASSVAGHRRAFGADVVPGCYEDLDEADLIILVGSNAAWCHPVLFRRMLKNRRERGAKLVVIDPRRTATAEEADLHLAIAPGMDSALFCALLAYLSESRAMDTAYIQAHTQGFEVTLARAKEIAPSTRAAAQICQLPESGIATLFDWFRVTERTVTCYSQGVNQSAQGTDKVNAVINCHLATGRIGRPGMGPFSLTGQPNAMGGREAGGLANQLAAHMSFAPQDVDRVARFWNAPRMAEREGLKAVDMFEAIERGEIKALCVMGTNPAVSLPRARAVSAALAKLDVFIVSDNVRSNDTINSGAHILLPAAAWGEKDGTVTNSERRISRQRAFLPLPGEVRPDWWIVSEVARRLGFGGAFDYSGPGDIFREHAALSAFENHGSRAFDLSGLSKLSRHEYDALEPAQWPISADREGASARLFAEGGFITPDAKARFVPVASPALAAATDAEFPLLLNTGRLRDQWHTMTRTGLSVRLGEHAPEPVLEVSFEDAARYKLEHHSFARVFSQHGSCVFLVRVTDAQVAGSVFAPIHWNGETAPSARISDLVAPATDLYSGQPEAKATPCAVAPIEFATRGVILSRQRMELRSHPYWTRIPIEGGFLQSFATDDAAAPLADSVMRELCDGCDVSEYVDEEGGLYRLAAFRGEKLDLSLFAGPAANGLPDLDILKGAFAKDRLSTVERIALLSGSNMAGHQPQGETVCACFSVRAGAIRNAISEGNRDLEAIGCRLKAGTNCGSCQPELRRILREELAAAN